MIQYLKEREIFESDWRGWMAETAWVTNPIGVAAVIMGIIALSFWLDEKVRWCSFLGTAIMVITGAAIVVNVGIIPSSVPSEGEAIHPVYSFSNDYAVPLAIVLLLLTVDLRGMRRLGKPALIAFGLACVGTVAGTLAADLLFGMRIGEEHWKIAGQYAASYIGGGINYAAVGAAFQTSESLYAAGAAADNIMTNIWMVVTALLPMWWIRKSDSIEEANGHEGSQSAKPERAWSMMEWVILLAAAFFIVWGAQLIMPILNRWIGFEIPVVLGYTTLALAANLLTPLHRFQGGEETGILLLHFFFATMGAGTILETLVDKGPILFLFLVITVIIHGVIVFALGRWWRLDPRLLAVASQATVGGPSTALALASSQGWKQLVTPGVLMGLMGYAIGNYVGIAVGTWLK